MQPNPSHQSPIDSDFRSVERLTFPLKVVISLVSSALVICIWILSVTWEMRSDMRDLNTRSAAQDRLWEERISNIKDSLSAIRRMQDVQQYEIQAIKLSLTEAGIRIRYPKE